MQIKALDHIRYRRGVFSVNDFFLTQEYRADAGINYFIQCPENINNALQPFYTLLIDLRQPVEAIEKDVYHRTLTEIRSFTANQQFGHQLVFPVPEKELDRFLNLFDAFAGEKNIRKAERARLKAYNTHGILALSYIQQQDQLLCVNIYRLTQSRACNLHSFFVKSTFNTSHLGRAHRALHWLDLVRFKQEGVMHYDLGGWYEGDTDKELLNINRFKEQFTQHKVKEYTGVICKNKILSALLALRKRWKRT